MANIKLTRLPVVADEFSTSVSYAVGAFVERNGALYKCIVAHSGTWDDSHWTVTKVTDNFGTGSVTDVQVNGTSCVSGNVANVPLASSTAPGAIVDAASDSKEYVRKNGAWVEASGGTITDVQVGGSTCVSGGVASIPNASDSQVGVIQDVPAYGTADVEYVRKRTASGVSWVANSGGTASVADVTVDGTSIVDTTSKKAQLVHATTSGLGLVKVGGNIDVDSTGVISVATGSTSALGVVKTGDNITNTDGTISVPIASKNDTAENLGVVKPSITYQNTTADRPVISADANGALNVKIANTAQYGVVQIGDNISQLRGVISIADASATAKGVVQMADGYDASSELAASGKIIAGAFQTLAYSDTAVTGQAVRQVKESDGIIEVTRSATVDTVQVNGTALTNTDGVVNVPAADDSTYGVVKTDGTTTEIVDGKLHVKGMLTFIGTGSATAFPATAAECHAIVESVKGTGAADAANMLVSITVSGVFSGQMICTAAGTPGTWQQYSAVAVPDATTTSKGIMQVGDNLSVSSGVVSVPVASTTAAGVAKVAGTFGAFTDSACTSVNSDGVLCVKKAAQGQPGVVNLPSKSGGAVVGIDSTGQVLVPYCDTETSSTSTVGAVQASKSYESTDKGVVSASNTGILKVGQASGSTFGVVMASSNTYDSTKHTVDIAVDTAGKIWAAGSSAIDVSFAFTTSPAYPTGKTYSDYVGKDLYAVVDTVRYPVVCKPYGTAQGLFYYVDFNGSSFDIKSSIL